MNERIQCEQRLTRHLHHCVTVTIAALFPKIYLVFCGHERWISNSFSHTHSHWRAPSTITFAKTIYVTLRRLNCARWRLALTNFDRAPIVSRSIIDFNQYAYLPAACISISLFLPFSRREWHLLKPSHYMFNDTHGRSINHWNVKSAIRKYRRIPFD